MWNNLIKTKEKVKYILENYESTRDDDMKLLSMYWLNETNATIFFLQDLPSLTPAESIMRCRRKLQEQYPNLRGNRYEVRQAECDLITKQIRLL
jgi:hypothetical protein